MPRLPSLLHKAAALKQGAANIQSKIDELRERQAKFESEKPDYSKIDTLDDATLLNITARKTAVEILPTQIKQLDAQKGSIMRELETCTKEIKQELQSLASAEQENLIAEISGKLAPYSIPQQIDCGGKLEWINPAESAAWSMPIVRAVGDSLRLQTKAVSISFSREQYSERFDKETAEHYEEVLATAKRFLDNRNSFVRRDLFKNRK